MQIRNKHALARELILDGEVVVVEPGDTIDVPAEMANGTKPTGKEGDPEYRAGTSGLLAQEDVWEPAPGPGKSDAAHAKKADKDEEN